MSDVLLVCHANQCRSPMAEALLRRRFADAGLEASVASAGFATQDQPVASGVEHVLARRKLELADHRSRIVTEADLDDAALVIGLERHHVRELVLMSPDVWPRAFTLKELVRRGEAVGVRRQGESADDWIARVHEGRTREDLVGADEHDDVEDPMGGSRAEFERTAVELDDLVTRLVALLVGDRPAGARFSGYNARTTAASP